MTNAKGKCLSFIRSVVSQAMPKRRRADGLQNQSESSRMNCARVLQMNELLASFRKIRLAVMENHLLCSVDMQAGHKTQSSALGPK